MPKWGELGIRETERQKSQSKASQGCHRSFYGWGGTKTPISPNPQCSLIETVRSTVSCYRERFQIPSREPDSVRMGDSAWIHVTYVLGCQQLCLMKWEKNITHWKGTCALLWSQLLLSRYLKFLLAGKIPIPETYPLISNVPKIFPPMVYSELMSWACSCSGRRMVWQLWELHTVESLTCMWIGQRSFGTSFGCWLKYQVKVSA